MNFSFAVVPCRSFTRLGLSSSRLGSSVSLGRAVGLRFPSPCANTERRQSTLVTLAKASTSTFPCKYRPCDLGPPQRPRPRVDNHSSLRTYATRKPRQPVIHRYEDLPESYRDKDGLPFRDSDLSSAEVKRIFGQSTVPSTANKLLRILHGRRVAGTLSDPAYEGNTASFSSVEKDKALDHLRNITPVDEVLNAGLRAEDELAMLEQEANGDEAASGESERDGTGEGGEGRRQASPSKANSSTSVYGDSVFDNIRARNIAKREERERQEAIEREELERSNPGPLAQMPEKPRELSPRMKKWTEEATSGITEPPEMTHVERLLPGTTFVLLFVAGLAAFALVYSPPSHRDRLFPEVSPAAATVGTLIALNILIWAAWRVPPLWKYMNRHFVLVHGLPRAPTLVLSVFSHSSFTHLVPNMVALGLFGMLLHEEVGRANFLAIYLASGAVGFLGSLWLLSLQGLLMYSSIGASGAVYGIAGAYFWLHRFDPFKILGFPPEPMEGPQGLGFIALVVGLHIWALLRPGRATMDLTSHMAGMAAGIGGAHLVQRRQMVKGGVTAAAGDTAAAGRKPGFELLDKGEK